VGLGRLGMAGWGSRLGCDGAWVGPLLAALVAQILVSAGGN
jgi:hypothetical protein